MRHLIAPSSMLEVAPTSIHSSSHHADQAEALISAGTGSMAGSNL
jgi:hypothetical protein